MLSCTECPASKPEYMGKRTIAKPRTNGDNLRAMSDEELAQWLCDVGECDRRCPAKIGDCIFSDSACIGAWLDWLKEEAKDG